MNRYKLLVLLGLSVWLVMSMSGPTLSQSPEGNFAKATFAGGCFWCMEHPFDELDGVVSTTSGYTGGHTVDPTYPEVSAGGTGHTEALQIEYDPTKVTYEELLNVYWRNVDPTTPDAQFCDHGNQYRPEIFYHTAEQTQFAEASRTHIGKNQTFPEPIVIDSTQGTTFYAADDFHQIYYQTNPLRYKFYRLACGRDSRLAELWGDA